MSCGWKPKDPLDAPSLRRCPCRSLDADVVRMETRNHVRLPFPSIRRSLDADVVRMETRRDALLFVARFHSRSLDADVVRMETVNWRRPGWPDSRRSLDADVVRMETHTRISSVSRAVISRSLDADVVRMETKSGHSRSGLSSAGHSTQMSCGWKPTKFDAGGVACATTGNRRR